jgi:hypothetical protein
LLQPGSKLELLAALIVLATAVPLAAYLAGYSAGSEDSVVDTHVVRSDIENSAPGSPERALLTWWRDLQLGHVKAATAFYEPALGISRKRLRAQRERVAAAGKAFIARTPVIEDSEIDSNRATLHTYLKGRREGTEGQQVTTYDPHTFLLSKVGDTWLLSDNAYIAEVIATAGDSDGQADSVNGAEIAGRNFVSNGDVATTEPGTPERALLEWFRAVQFGDVREVEDLTTPEELDEVDSAKLFDAVETVNQSLGRPDIDEVRVDGNRAFARLFLLSYEGDNPEPTFARALTLRMKEQGGKWKVDEVGFLIDQAEAVKAAD